MEFSLIARIVQAADAISAARPGARRETLGAYTTRLTELEELSNNFEGVEKTFAIHAGREIRVMVIPEKITDDDMVLLAHDISKKIEDELKYPGQVIGQWFSTKDLAKFTARFKAMTRPGEKITVQGRVMGENENYWICEAEAINEEAEVKVKAFFEIKKQSL